jgi:hypothetical protein
MSNWTSSRTCRDQDPVISGSGAEVSGRAMSDAPASVAEPAALGR